MQNRTQRLICWLLLQITSSFSTCLNEICKLYFFSHMNAFDFEFVFTYVYVFTEIFSLLCNHLLVYSTFYHSFSFSPADISLILTSPFAFNVLLLLVNYTIIILYYSIFTTVLTEEELQNIIIGS